MAQVDHHSVYGQSWAMGAGVGAVAITLASPDPTHVFMPATGPRQRPDGQNEIALDPNTILNTQALVENNNAGVPGVVGVQGETICAGMGYWLKANTDIALLNKLTLATHGRGGYSIAQLSKGQQPYSNGQILIARLKALVNSVGASFGLGSLNFLQGEADEALNSTGTWKAALELLRQNYETDMFAITGQASKLPIFIYQITNAWYWFATGNPGNAGSPKMQEIMLSAHVDNPLVRLVTPLYMFPSSPDEGHLTPNSYRWLGEYFGRAVRDFLYTGVGWECLRPYSIIKSGAVIDILLTGNSAPIAFDTTLVSDDPAKGFIVTINGIQIPIVSALISGINSIRLLLGYNLEGVTVVNYAFPLSNPNFKSGNTYGSRGNVRDSYGPASVFGNPPLYKWLVAFTKTLNQVQ